MIDEVVLAAMFHVRIAHLKFSLPILWGIMLSMKLCESWRIHLSHMLTQWQFTEVWRNEYVCKNTRNYWSVYLSWKHLKWELFRNIKAALLSSMNWLCLSSTSCPGENSFHEIRLTLTRNCYYSGAPKNCFTKSYSGFSYHPWITIRWKVNNWKYKLTFLDPIKNVPGVFRGWKCYFWSPADNFWSQIALLKYSWKSYLS